MCLICCCWGTVRALAFGEPLGSPTKGRCPLATRAGGRDAEDWIGTKKVERGCLLVGAVY